MAARATKAPGAVPFLATAVTLAFCSLVYELMFAKVIAESTGNATVWEAVSMAVFLCGLGLRTLRTPPAGDEALVRTLWATELLLPAVATLGLLLLTVLEILYRTYVYDGGMTAGFLPFPTSLLLGIAAQPVNAAVGWLSGFELQFFLAYGLDGADGPGARRRAPAVLAAYHAGGLLGTGAFALHLIGGADPMTVVAVTAAMNLLVAAAIRVRLMPAADTRSWLTLGAATLAVGAGPSLAGGLERLQLVNRYYNLYNWSAAGDGGLTTIQHPVGPLELARRLDDLPRPRRIRSPYQVIDLVPAGPDGRRGDAMYINGRFQISADTTAAYHEYLVHPAIAMQPAAPARVLILGGGDGPLLAEVLKYGPAVQEITLVDIDPVVVGLARTEPFLTRLNDNALNRPGYTLVIADALQWLRQDHGVFDAVFLDLTYPFEFDSARFLSAEYLRLIRRRLSPHGYLVVGAPDDLVNAGHPGFETIVQATMTKAGFTHGLAWNGDTHHYLMIGHQAPKPDPSLMVGLSLKVLTPELLRRMPTRSLRLTGGSGRPYSVFAPRALGLPDPFY